MKKKSTISVIVPIYNVEKYLYKCLKSIEMQVFFDFEVLLIDDGSTDSSSRICQDFVKKDKRFIYFFKTNGGLSSARNYGLMHANGKYVCFVDSDDYIDIDFLSRLFGLIVKGDYDIAQCSFAKIYKEELEIKQTPIIIEEIIDNEKILKEYLDKNELKNRIYHNVCNKLFKRSLFSDIRFVEGIYYEDLAIMYKLLEKSNSIILTNEQLYYYNRTNINSITKNINYKHIKDGFEVVQKIYNDLNKNIYIREELSSFVINQLINYYELSFDVKKTKDINEFRKKIKNTIVEMNNHRSFSNKIKMYIRLILPRLHKKYRILLGR